MSIRTSHKQIRSDRGDKDRKQGSTQQHDRLTYKIPKLSHRTNRTVDDKVGPTSPRVRSVIVQEVCSVSDLTKLVARLDSRKTSYVHSEVKRVARRIRKTKKRIRDFQRLLVKLQKIQKGLQEQCVRQALEIATAGKGL